MDDRFGEIVLSRNNAINALAGIVTANVAAPASGGFVRIAVTERQFLVQSQRTAEKPRTADIVSECNEGQECANGTQIANPMVC